MLHHIPSRAREEGKPKSVNWNGERQVPWKDNWRKMKLPTEIRVKGDVIGTGPRVAFWGMQ